MLDAMRASSYAARPHRHEWGPRRVSARPPGTGSAKSPTSRDAPSTRPSNTWGPKTSFIWRTRRCGPRCAPSTLTSWAWCHCERWWPFRGGVRSAGARSCRSCRAPSQERVLCVDAQHLRAPGVRSQRMDVAGAAAAPGRTRKGWGDQAQGRHRFSAWTMTAKGRRRLARARRVGAIVLPESPQHKVWREARELAGERIDRFRAELRDALGDTHALLDAEDVGNDPGFDPERVETDTGIKLGG